MIFDQHFPAYPLNQFIESFVYYRDYNPVHSVDRFLPDGYVNIVIDLTDYPKYIYDNDTLKEIQACRNVWYSGIRTKYITIPSGKDSEMFVINFHRGKAYPFIEMPAHELTDSVVDGELVLTAQIMGLREMLLEKPLIADKFRTAEKYLIRKFQKKLIVNPFIDYAVDKIISSPDHLSIDSVSRKVGYSQKHLIKLFKDNVGLTPKAFLKVIRFQKVIQEIAESKRIDWTGIAFDAGFYDQAHFINDFREFSGFTPEQYMQKHCDYLNYIPIG